MSNHSFSSSPTASASRLRLVTPSEIRSAFREDVAHGLQQPQKAIPPKYFYDRQGSLLFEEICRQPEYYLTRTETAILTRYAAAIVDVVGECAIVELGSGSSLKTRLLLDECQRRYRRAHYIPVDISASMLEATARKLLEEYPHLRIDALAADYLTGLSVLPAAPRRLALFLGSNLGNFSPSEQEQLFRQLARTLQRGDFLLIGLDLRKPLDVVEPAYNDAAGVTAAFNLNLLQRMNRELRADFDLGAFSHVAFYNPIQHQIEMHLRSEREQQVAIRDLSLAVSFHAGETIHTEISRKFDLDEIDAQLALFGFRPRARWSDARSWFAVCLFRFSGPLNPEV
ncbi:MAG: L-histidine N(alpha)-methyltransferase [Deltaproteobacteria bacterium]|nr:L-histidine N(alpha)-methyltransferase [Deltaproteobacteria bacterium]